MSIFLAIAMSVRISYRHLGAKATPLLCGDSLVIQPPAHATTPLKGGGTPCFWPISTPLRGWNSLLSLKKSVMVGYLPVIKGALHV